MFRVLHILEDLSYMDLCNNQHQRIVYVRELKLAKWMTFNANFCSHSAKCVVTNTLHSANIEGIWLTLLSMLRHNCNDFCFECHRLHPNALFLQGLGVPQDYAPKQVTMSYLSMFWSCPQPMKIRRPKTSRQMRFFIQPEPGVLITPLQCHKSCHAVRMSQPVWTSSLLELSVAFFGIIIFYITSLLLSTC